MANLTQKRNGELLQKLFHILEEHPDGMRAKDALDALENAVTLTEYEAGTYKSGRRFEKIVRFATVDTVRTGWLIKDNGVWTLTKEGSNALKEYKDPSLFSKEANLRYRNWRKLHKSVQKDFQSLIDENIEEIEEESNKSICVS
jgi:restriction system protein